MNTKSCTRKIWGEDCHNCETCLTNEREHGVYQFCDWFSPDEYAKTHPLSPRAKELSDEILKEIRFNLGPAFLRDWVAVLQLPANTFQIEFENCQFTHLVVKDILAIAERHGAAICFAQGGEFPVRVLIRKYYTA